MHLHLLGSPRLWMEDEGHKPPSLQLLLLVAYLASHDTWVNRGQIVSWLWPDDNEKAGRHNLSQLLYRHRRKIWLSGFESTPQSLRWRTDSDVRDFRRAVAEGSWDEALSHYGGLFLEGTQVDEVATVMDWLEQERSDLQSAWRDATLQRARQLCDVGEFAEAAKRLATAWQQDTLAEDVLQAYIESAAKAGQRDQALQAFKRFETQLADELAMEPLATTRALASAVRDGTLAPPVNLGATPELNDKTPQSSLPHVFAAGLRGDSLPHDPTSFVGRDLERLELAQLLAEPDCRLLSILGPGGMGKSRLATRVAREQHVTFTDGSVFVALAALNSKAALPMAFIKALGLEPSVNHDALDDLCHYLADKTMLLVIDNVEHLRASTAAIITRLLDAAPNLKIITTSREALGLRGEWHYELNGLAFPDNPQVEQVEAYDAVRLFVQSARRTDPHLHLSPEDRVAIATICKLVQGTPLGIELAAVWLRMLSPQELVDELMYDLDLLEREAADIPQRHRSLRAVFEHSWALLCQDEQQLLAQLSVFEGGLSKEAAQQVAQANLRTLLALVNKSLLRRSDSGRFEMLETIRHYATEKLASDQPMLTETKVRHARYFLSLAETASTKLSGAEQTKWLGHLTTDHDNLRLALDWSLQTHHADTSLRLVAALWWFWQVCGHLQEGKAWLERVLALPETATPSKIRAKALRGAGVIAWMQGDLDTAKVHFAEALQILAELGDEHDTARVLNNLGVVFYLQQDYERAEQTLHRGLELFKQLSDEYNTTAALGNLGLVTYMRGDLEATHRTCEEVLTRFQVLHDFWGTAISHSNLARVLCSQGHYAEAAVHYHIGIELAHQNGAQRLLASLFEGLARLFAYVDAPIYAATLWGAAETLRHTLGAPREPIDEVDYNISIRKTKTASQATLFERAWEEGKHTGLEDVVTFALTQTISYTSS